MAGTKLRVPGGTVEERRGINRLDPGCPERADLEG